MRKVSLSIGLGILFTLALIHSPLIGSSVSAEAVSLAQGRSSIYGTVYGDARRPVADVYVELLDDFNASIRQNKTDASGRFLNDDIDVEKVLRPMASRNSGDVYDWQ